MDRLITLYADLKALIEPAHSFPARSSENPQDLLKTAPSPETDLRFKQIGGE